MGDMTIRPEDVPVVNHEVSEAEERVINLKDTNGINAIANLYEMIVSAFSFQLEVDGETKQLTRDQLSTYYRHPAPDLRAAAYQEHYRVSPGHIQPNLVTTRHATQRHSMG